MRICCINECSSRYADKNGRSFFKVGRELLDTIKKHQTISENRQIYICDLHFDANDIIKGKTKSTLRQGSLPKLDNNSSLIDYISTRPQNHTENFGETPEDLNRWILETSKLQKTIEELKNVIKMKDNEIEKLKEPKEIHNLTSAQREVIDCLINGMGGKQYPENVRQFCLRQQFYSMAAYESLRSFFSNNLPTRRTIRLWYSSVDGTPGINSSALDTIREEAESYRAANVHQLHVTLISDEMSIRKHISWNKGTEKFDGFSTVTSHESRDSSSESTQLSAAKDSLVFLIVGPNFKIPVAYYFLNGLDGIDRAALTSEVVKCVEECDIRIISLTSDGLNANFTVAKLLGAKFDEKKPYFKSPSYPDQKIYVIFDPPHMLKLVRKQFSNNKLYSQKGLVDWNLLQILVERQRQANFNLCNKLTQHHINWHERPMNVRLAAETISNSVADVLEQLKNDEYEEFQDAESTVEFLRTFNDLFDILNFSSKSHPNGKYKQAIRYETIETIFPFLEQVEKYIGELQIETKTKKGIVRKPILNSIARVGFLGFQMDIISLRGIYNDFVEMGSLDVFYTMQFSQDHLETFFSLIRNSLGRNDNPNVSQFCSAFRKLLICHPLTTSLNQNVISNATGILTKPAAPKKKTAAIVEMEEFEVIEINFDRTISREINKMEPFETHTCAYLASRIEHEIKKHSKTRTRTSCSECIEILSQDKKISDELLAKKIESFAQPCESTMDIVVFSNATMDITSGLKHNFDGVQKTICSNLDMDKLFTGSDFVHGDENHKQAFVSKVVKTYLTLKSQNIGNRITDEERGAFIRNRLKSRIHELGQ